MSNINILIVDDDNDWCNILEGDLRSGLIGEYSINITCSQKLNDSIRYIDNNKWDLMIVDINLKPNEDDKFGLTLARNGALKKIPMIIVSGKLDTDDYHQLYQSKSTKEYLKGFFSKKKYPSPNVVEEFISKVRQILLKSEIPSNLNNESNDNELIQLSDSDKLYLIKKLSTLAYTAIIASKEYFRDLVNRLKLPDQLKQEIADVWIGNTSSDSTKLINWILDRNIYPKNSNQSGITVLGNLIKIMLEESGDTKLLNIIINNDLINNQEIINNLKQKYDSTEENSN